MERGWREGEDCAPPRGAGVPPAARRREGKEGARLSRALPLAKGLHAFGVHDNAARAIAIPA